MTPEIRNFRPGQSDQRVKCNDHYWHKLAQHTTERSSFTHTHTHTHTHTKVYANYWSNACSKSTRQKKNNKEDKHGDAVTKTYFPIWCIPFCQLVDTFHPFKFKPNIQDLAFTSCQSEDTIKNPKRPTIPQGMHVGGGRPGLHYFPRNIASDSFNYHPPPKIAIGNHSDDHTLQWVELDYIYWQRIKRYNGESWGLLSWNRPQLLHLSFTVSPMSYHHPPIFVLVCGSTVQ